MVLIGKESFNNVPDWTTAITPDRTTLAEISDCSSLQILSMDIGTFVAFNGITLTSMNQLLI